MAFRWRGLSLSLFLRSGEFPRIMPPELQVRIEWAALALTAGEDVRIAAS